MDPRIAHNHDKLRPATDGYPPLKRGECARNDATGRDVDSDGATAWTDKPDVGWRRERAGVRAVDADRDHPALRGVVGDIEAEIHRAVGRCQAI